jgi:AmmeMemoRadiSam system protein A
MSSPATHVDDAARPGGAVAEVGPPPAVTPADQLALLRLARSAVARQLGAPSSASIPRMSPSLLQRVETVFVTLWVDGAMRGCHGADGRVLCQNTLEAARHALQDDRVAPLRRDELDRLRIEIDVLGPPARIAASTPEEARALIEPGIHGMLAEKDGRRAIFRSSVAITRNWRVEELMRRLCEKGGWAPDAYRDGELELSRFRSTAFIESARGDGGHELVRGHRPIVATDWSRDRVTRAIRDGADYLLRAQRPDGGFAYEYDPARGTYSSADHVVRQLATMWLVAQLSRREDTARCRDVLTRALPYIRARLQRLPARDVLVVSDKVDGAPLGGAAFALLTLVAAEDDTLGDEARDLADAILSLQRPDGGFHTEFPGATRPELEDFYPGEAMLALMLLHARYPDPRYPASLRHALPYYRAHFRRQPSSAFVAWQMAAYAQLYRTTGEREYADFVFELADAIVPHQHVGAAVPYPDYIGGYRGGAGPGIPSATYNEGVLDALDVAKRTGDRERMARYQRAGLLAALFTLRLQLTEDSAYYVAHPERALGAFRASLVDGALRIDHTQHALNSFLKAERRLFGNAAETRPRREVVRAPSPS